MFFDFIAQLYAGCTNPMEYVIASLFFIFLLEFFARLIGALLSICRRV